jgi:hypothetical protein
VARTRTAPRSTGRRRHPMLVALIAAALTAISTVVAPPAHAAVAYPRVCVSLNAARHLQEGRVHIPVATVHVVGRLCSDRLGHVDPARTSMTVSYTITPAGYVAGYSIDSLGQVPASRGTGIYRDVSYAAGRTCLIRVIPICSPEERFHVLVTDVDTVGQAPQFLWQGVFCDNQTCAIEWY